MSRPGSYCYSLVALLAAILAGGCAPSSPGGSSDRATQFGQNRNAMAVNALGESLSLADFGGKRVWVDYAAEWCAACKPQSAVIRSLAAEHAEDVVFITVMTSEPEGYGHPATQATAARWAQRAALDSSRVVAADLSSMTLPQHAFFSEHGTEVYRHTGPMTAAQIRATIQQNEAGRR